MDHGAHIQQAAAGDRRALTIAGILTGVYFLIELGVGILTGSVAVLSDAFHTFSAVGGVLIALVAGNIAQRGATRLQTFGLIRVEIVGALFNGLFLTGMAVFVFWIGIMRLREPIELPPLPMILVAVGGLITEAISFWLLYNRQKTNLNIKGAFWHIIQTFVGSLIIIVSATVIYFTGFFAIDPLLGMAFGVVLFWASWKIIRDSLHILLQGTPEDLDLNALIKDLRQLPGAIDIHHVHAWSLTSGRNVVSGHIRVRELEDINRLQKAAHDLLKNKYKIYFSTLQVEKNGLEAEAEVDEIDVVKREKL